MKFLAFAPLAAALLAVAPSLAPGQLNPYAPTDLIDEQASAPTGGVGGPGFNPIDRARDAAGQANARNDGGDGGFDAPPPGGPGGAPPPQDFGLGNNTNTPGGLGAFAVAGATGTLKAWGGERIVCRRTGQVLLDAREISVLTGAVNSYFDDGVNGNDAVAGDNIYTNISLRSDFLSPEAARIKNKLVTTLAYTSRITPQEFQQVYAATTEPLSPLPKVVDLEMQQDDKLRQWANDFLRDFRLNPDQMDSAFYPTFLPPPPKAPNIPLPVTFTPQVPERGPNDPNAPQGGPGAGAPAGPAPTPVSTEDDPTAGATSRYM